MARQAGAMRSLRGHMMPLAMTLALGASAQAGDGLPASPASVVAPERVPEPAACPTAGDTLELLRNAAVTSISPVVPPLTTVFGVASDPTLSPILDREVQPFASGGPFPHDSSDL